LYNAIDNDEILINIDGTDLTKDDSFIYMKDNTVDGGVIVTGVSDVNGNTGSVTLDADDMDDSVTSHKFVTSTDLVTLSNTSGVNTGDETTSSIQSKRPLKTIGGSSLEGSGNISLGLSNVVYVDSLFTGTSDGSITSPFKTVQDALDNATGTVNIEILNKEIIITQAITLPSTLSTIIICGNSTTIKYASYDVNTIENVIEQTNSAYTGIITLKGLKLQNGTNGLLVNSASKVVIDNCHALNNGYNNTNFSTILPSSGSRLGYDSAPVDLQAFYASEVEDSAAGFNIRSTPFVEISGCTIKDNNLGILLTDCGINGAGYITRNQITQNFNCSIAMSLDYSDPQNLGEGCQNIITTINSLSYNGSFGVICYGGINNKFSQNDLTKN
jgi:hypothetical protein